MRSITIVSEDRIGLLADISYILSKASINIESLSVDVIGKNAIIVLTVKDPNHALEVLHRNGYSAAEMDSIVIKVPNRPGEMTKIANMLLSEGINVENMRTLSADNNTSIFSLVVDKPRKATRLLSDRLLHNNLALNNY